MTHNAAIEVANRYFNCIRERNLAGILGLFAGNASCIMPDGRAFSGPDAVRDWFSKLFSMPALTPQILSIVADETTVAVEIGNELPDGSQRNTANFFQLDSEGLIAQLHAYRRG